MKNNAALITVGLLFLMLSITILRDSPLKLYGLGLSILLLLAAVLIGLKKKA